MTSLRSTSPIIAAGVLLLACGAAEDAAHDITPTGAGDAPASSRSRPTRADRGRGAPQLPENFPKDVPLYSPSTLVEVLSGDGRQAVSFTTEAGSQEVARFYREELRDNGWTLEDAIEFRGQVMLSGSKKGRQVSVFIMSREEHTTVAVSISSN